MVLSKEISMDVRPWAWRFAERAETRGKIGMGVLKGRKHLARKELENWGVHDNTPAGMLLQG